MKRYKYWLIILATIVLLITSHSCGGGGRRITNVKHALSGNSAIITWNASQEITSWVEYGPTTEYGDIMEPDTIEQTSHRAVITGLDPHGTYHYRICCLDSIDNESMTQDYTFTLFGAVISDVSLTDITTSSANLSWATDVPTTSRVEYDTTMQFISPAVLDGPRTTSHSAAFNDLELGTRYFYRLRCTRGTGLETVSDIYSFRTTGKEIWDVVATNITGKQATITWKTDIAATSQVEYGTTTAYGSTTALDTTLVTSHSVVLTGLTLDTTYHYRVLSSFGTDSRTSVDATFNTYTEPVTYEVGVLALPSTNNPFNAVDGGTDGAHIGIMYESLVQLHNNGTVIPLLADSWDYDTENHFWTFNIDPQAKWSNGQPVTAGDVWFTYQMAQSLDSGYGDEITDKIQSVTILNDTTIRFGLFEPVGAFPQLLAGIPIVPEFIWQNMTDEEVLAFANDDPVCSGPFVVRGIVPGSHVVYDARQDYWGGAPNIDVFIKTFYGRDDEQLLALRTGEIDATDELAIPTAVPLLMWDDDIETYEIHKNATYTWYLNHRIEPFDMVDFRRALSIGIDRMALVNFAADGWAVMPNLIEVPPHLVYVADGIEWPYSELISWERIELANELLDTIPGISTIEDGVDGIRLYNGDPLQFEVLVCDTAMNVEEDSAAQIIQNNCYNLGIDLVIEQLSPAQLVDRVFRQSSETAFETADGWDSIIWGRSFASYYDYLADQWGYTEDDWSTRGIIMGWRNEDIQDDLSALQALPDGNAARDALIQSTQLEMAEELPCIPLFHEISPNAYRTDRFEGWIADSGLWMNGVVPSTIDPRNLLSLTPITIVVELEE